MPQLTAAFCRIRCKMRRDAREVVFKLLYAESFVGDFSEELFEQLATEQNLGEQDAAFAKSLLLAVKDNYDSLMTIISDLAINYLAERIYPTDKCALLIGLCEMTYFDDVPNIVAIDEALALCKKYSTEKSLNFVNGIFANYKSKIEK